MRRRDFITLLGGAAAWPLAVRAQQPAMPVIGFLRSTPAAGFAYLVNALRQGLNDAGFVEGKNVVIEYRWADDQHDRLPGLAADLVRRQVAVIVANGIAVPALKAATATIPIVFLAGADPVRTGLVASLSRPERNVTGVVFTITDLAAKHMGLLHELVPKAAVIAVLGDANYPEIEVEFRELEAASSAIGRQILIVKAGGERDFNAAFATIVKAGAGALVVRGGPVFLNQRRQLVALAARHALPAASGIPRSRWPDELWAQPERCLSSCRRLRRPNTQGRETRRPAGRAGEQVRIGHKCRDSQGNGPRHSANASRPRRRGHRMSAPGKAGAIQPVEVRPK
jgi:putative ABC transport system substrate-binding protein